MHKLGSRLFFSSFLVYLAEQTSRRVTASHRHCVHALCLTCGLHVHSRCACVRACAHAPGVRLPRLPLSMELWRNSWRFFNWGWK